MLERKSIVIEKGKINVELNNYHEEVELVESTIDTDRYGSNNAITIQISKHRINFYESEIE
jgi:hypothetical protein